MSAVTMAHALPSPSSFAGLSPHHNLLGIKQIDINVGNILDKH